MGIVSGKESALEDVPAALYRSAVWAHFAFGSTYDDGGMKVVDKSATVCEHCATDVVYANSNTTNMSAHRSSAVCVSLVYAKFYFDDLIIWIIICYFR